jgi:hypothetical protein
VEARTGRDWSERTRLPACPASGERLGFHAGVDGAPRVSGVPSLVLILESGSVETEP